MNFTKSGYLLLIIVAVFVTLITNFGSLINFTKYFTFLSLSVNEYGYLNIRSFEETFFTNNEWWRLISPIFLHFSFAHLVFNCLWIYVLGEKIEKIDGVIIFIILVIFSSLVSNYLQYFWTSNSIFGGLSGVVYGLLGFCMILDMEESNLRYDLPPALYLFMIIWLVLGFLGILELFGFGSIANFAHLGGLFSGIFFAMIYKSAFKTGK